MSALIIIGGVFMGSVVLWRLALWRNAHSLAALNTQFQPISEEQIHKILCTRQIKRVVDGKRCLITGGNGFVGKKLAQRMLEEEWEVVIFDIVDSEWRDIRTKMIVGDLRDKDTVMSALEGVDTVFHVASPHAECENNQLLFQVNVIGTQNLLLGCLQSGVERLILTSSASVVYDGTDQKAVDESAPYPKQHRDAYCVTKSIAEQEVLRMNGVGDENGKLFTCALRPHGIFGPGEVQLLPRLIEMAQRGKNKYQIGDGSNVVDFTYVDNVVHAHVLAARALRGEGKACGKVYFVTNAEPIPFWTFMSRLLVGLGYNAPSITIPYGVCLSLSYVVDAVCKILEPIVKIRSTFTPSRVQLAGTYHYYSSQNISNDLGYRPLVSMEEAITLYLEAFQHLHNPKSPFVHQSTNTKNVFTREEVAKHNTENDCWIIVDGKVYDVTKYIDIHPGGEAILNNAGADSSKGFHGEQHPDTAKQTITNFYIGDLSN